MARHRRRKPAQAAHPPAADDADHSQRLQKVLAAAGLGSRRQCEELILEGRVDVDGHVVMELGAKADPEQQEIRVDGVALRPKLLHYVVNKPPGIVSTSNDPAGRPRVIDLVPPHGERLFSVGRLDMSSEGLILVTNDGDLANLLTHPRYGVDKTYHVEVAGALEKEDLLTLRKGVYLAEGFARVVHVRIKSQFKKSTLLEIVLDEGRNREIRRLLARVGHKVLRLKRVALGPLRLGELPPGSFRPLERHELRKLREAAKPGKRHRHRRFDAGSSKVTGARPSRDSAQRQERERRAATIIGGDPAPRQGSKSPRPRKRPSRVVRGGRQ